jgi:hypothetical protein
MFCAPGRCDATTRDSNQGLQRRASARATSKAFQHHVARQSDPAASVEFEELNTTPLIVSETNIPPAAEMRDAIRADLTRASPYHIAT